MYVIITESNCNSKYVLLTVLRVPNNLICYKLILLKTLSPQKCLRNLIGSFVKRAYLKFYFINPDP